MTRTFGALQTTGAALSAGLAVTVVILATACSASAVPSCDVTNTRSHARSGSLQAAVAGAKAGDRLRVSGVCIGTTVIDREIVIRGTLDASGRAALDGGRAGRVLEVESGVVVHLSGLLVRHGKAVGGFGGGILNRGKLTLRDVTVLSNRADSGGGIYSTGDLLLNGTTVVKHNRALLDDGGGVYVDGGRLTATGSSAVHHNTAGRGGGGIYGVDADLALDGTAAVHRNHAATGGGGIYADFESVLALRGSTAVHDNVADQNGGGVFDNSSVSLSDASSIESNTASQRGGGVYVGCFAALTGADAGTNVRGNHRSNLARETGCRGAGAGASAGRSDAVRVTIAHASRAASVVVRHGVRDAVTSSSRAGRAARTAFSASSSDSPESSFRWCWTSSSSIGISSSYLTDCTSPAAERTTSSG